MLKVEGVGKAVFSRNGQRIVFEMLAPYNSGDGNVYVFGGMLEGVLSRIYAASGGENRAYPLFEQRADRGYRIDALSPEGRKLAFHTVKDGVRRPGVYDFEKEAAEMFEFVLPDASFFPFTPIWLSENEIVYVTKGEKDETELRNLAHGFQWQIGARSQALARERSWSNEGVAVTVLGAGRYQTKGHLLELERLVKINLQAGERMVLDEQFFLAEGLLSPSGRYLAMVAQRGLLPIASTQDLANSRNTIELNREGLVIVYDLGTGESTIVCEQCQPALESLAWSPAADELLVFFAPTGEPKADGQFYRYDPRASRLKPISLDAQFVSPDRADWLQDVTSMRLGASWIGRSAVFQVSEGDDDGRTDWIAVAPDGKRTKLTEGFEQPFQGLVANSPEAGFFVVDGDLWRVELSGKRKNLTAAYTPAVSVSSVGQSAYSRRLSGVEDIKTAVFQGQSETEVDFLFLNKEFTALDSVASLPSGVTPLAVSQSRRLLFREDKEDGRGFVRRQEPESKGDTLLGFNQHMEDTIPGQPVLLSYKSEDGQPLRSWLLLPPDASPDERHAAIVFAYPGTIVPDDWPGSAWFDTLHKPLLSMSAQLFAAHGYAVLIPDIPLSRPTGDPMIEMWPPVAAAIAEAARQGYVDENRLAVRGQSGGGYAVASLITQTDKFNAAIWSAGFSNLSSFYGQKPLAFRLSPYELVGTWSRYLENQGRMGEPPWIDPQRYLRNSPVFHADDITTPLMMIHGDLDSVNIDQAEEMFSALARQNKDVQLLTYWGEGHVVISPENLRDLWRRVFQFLNEHLGPVS